MQGQKSHLKLPGFSVTSGWGLTYTANYNRNSGLSRTRSTTVTIELADPDPSDSFWIEIYEVCTPFTLQYVASI